MAGRGMSAEVLAELDKDEVYFFNLLEFEWPEGTDYLTDFPRELEWNGNTYLSTGDLLEVPTISEQSQIQVNTVTFTLSGVNQANISKALSVKFIDLPVTIYRGFFSVNSSIGGIPWAETETWGDHQTDTWGATNSIIPEPFVLFKGYISSFSVQEDIVSGTSKLTWTVTSHWANFEMQHGRQTNDYLHQELYPGDKFFEFAGETVENFKWGRV